MRKPKLIPGVSGVYLFIGKDNKVFYVGRAVNLKRRVAQYFHPSASSRQAQSLEPRIAEMVRLAKKIEIKTTATLWQAIILEANLIKKYQPKYNIRDKDNKSFAYLAIPKRVPYPQPFVIRGQKLSKNQLPIINHSIFGPFQGVGELQTLLKIIRRAIPISMGRCAPLSGRPCFDYQLGLCPGACLGIISQQDYQKHIHNLVLLFSGQKQAVLGNLKKQNPEKAKILQRLQDVSIIQGENFKFEILNLKFAHRIEAYDISHFGGKNTYGAMAVMENGELDKSQYRLFKIRAAPASNDLLALQEMLERRLKHKEWPYPGLILVDGGIPQVRHVYKFLESLNAKIFLIGISKFQKDRLVFAPGLRLADRQKLQSGRPGLLGLRDEAHRFSNQARKRAGKGMV